MRVELEIIAFIGGMMCIGSSVPQLLRIIKIKDTFAISLSKYMMLTFSNVLWLAYGILTPAYTMIIWNSIGLILTGIICYLKLRDDYREGRLNLDFLYLFNRPRTDP